jgi:hypothetical protein
MRNTISMAFAIGALTAAMLPAPSLQPRPAAYGGYAYRGFAPTRGASFSKPPSIAIGGDHPM